MTTFHSTLASRAAIDRPFYREGLPKWKNVAYFPKFSRIKRPPKNISPEQFSPRPPESLPLAAERIKPLKNLPSMEAQATVEAAPTTKVRSTVSRKLTDEQPTKMLQPGQFTEIKVPKEDAVPQYQPWQDPVTHVQHDPDSGGLLVTDGATKKSVDALNRRTLGRSIASSTSGQHTRLSVKSPEPEPESLDLTDEPVGPHRRTRNGRTAGVAATMAEIDRVKRSLV